MANNTWKNYTQKSTALSDNDEVMLLDSTDEKNKRGLMSKFWDYVVDKMSTAVISKLETNNKTIIGAINALNSDSQMKKNFINPESTDDIIYGTTATIGFYKTGRTASIYFNIEAKQMLASNSFVTIANVPDSYLPEQNIILNYITQKGTPMLVNINKTKKIISLFNNNTEIKNDWVIRQVITYLSAS